MPKIFLSAYILGLAVIVPGKPAQACTGRVGSGVAPIQGEVRSFELKHESMCDNIEAYIQSSFASFPVIGWTGIKAEANLILLSGIQLGPWALFEKPCTINLDLNQWRNVKSGSNLPMDYSRQDALALAIESILWRYYRGSGGGPCRFVLNVPNKFSHLVKSRIIPIPSVSSPSYDHRFNNMYPREAPRYPKKFANFADSNFPNRHVKIEKLAEDLRKEQMIFKKTWNRRLYRSPDDIFKLAPQTVKAARFLNFNEKDVCWLEIELDAERLWIRSFSQTGELNFKSAVLESFRG